MTFSSGICLVEALCFGYLPSAMSMLNHPRTPRHYLVSPAVSSGCRTPTPHGGQGENSLHGSSIAWRREDVAAATVADMAQRDVPHGSMAQRLWDMPAEHQQHEQLGQPQREQLREQLRETHRQKLSATWCHQTQQPFVCPKRTSLSWFHGLRDEPLEFAPAVPSAEPAPPLRSLEVAAAATNELPRLQQPRSARSRPARDEALSEGPVVATIPGYTGHVGGRGDGTFGLGLSTTRIRAVASERRRPFAEVCSGKIALGRFFGALGRGATDAAVSMPPTMGSKYTEGPERRGGHASPAEVASALEAQSMVQRPVASWSSQRPSNSGAFFPT